jgi:hypothetical protein
MFGGGLRPINLVLNRGCVNNVSLTVVSQANCEAPEVPVSKADKKLYLTCKTQPWDTDADDSDATFKVLGTIPDSTNEPNRVLFTISEAQSYIDPTVPYFFDIVQTNSDDSNAQRLAIGQFTVIAGANNEQAGGEA